MSVISSECKPMKFRIWITAFNFDCSIWQWFCLFEILILYRISFWNSPERLQSNFFHSRRNMRAAVPEKKNWLEFNLEWNSLRHATAFRASTHTMHVTEKPEIERTKKCTFDDDSGDEKEECRIQNRVYYSTHLQCWPHFVQIHSNVSADVQRLQFFQWLHAGCL